MIRSALLVLAAFAAVSLLPIARASDSPADRAAADARFVAGYDHQRAGRLAEARREWTACLELDAAHEFCEFGLSVLDSKGLSGASDAPVTAAPPERWPAPAPESRDAQQAYLEGVIYFQKGDYEKARAAWVKAKELAPPGSDAAKDAAAGLDKINALYGATPNAPAAAPRNLKAVEEKKDEHQALQTYFTGLIYYQKGDLERARTEWNRAKALAPEESSVMSDAKAALEKLDKEQASTRGDRKK